MAAGGWKKWWRQARRRGATKLRDGECIFGACEDVSSRNLFGRRQGASNREERCSLFLDGEKGNTGSSSPLDLRPGSSSLSSSRDLLLSAPPELLLPSAIGAPPPSAARSRRSSPGRPKAPRRHPLPALHLCRSGDGRRRQQWRDGEDKCAGYGAHVLARVWGAMASAPRSSNIPRDGRSLASLDGDASRWRVCWNLEVCIFLTFFIFS
jgi:hypothetical protein